MNRRSFLGSLAAALGLATTCRKAPPLNAPATGNLASGMTFVYDRHVPKDTVYMLNPDYVVYGGSAPLPGRFVRERLRTHARRVYHSDEIVPHARQLELMSSPTTFDISKEEYARWERLKADHLRNINRSLFADGANLPTPDSDWPNDIDW